MDLKQDLELDDDKESVASEVPQETALEHVVNPGLIEKQALSEGGYSDHADEKSEVDVSEDQEDHNCSCMRQYFKKQRSKIKPIEVVRVLGEGSQGIVALCRFKQED